MSSDRVLGVGVLDLANFKLHVFGHDSKGRRHYTAIQAVPIGSTPANKEKPCWFYEIKGSSLLVHPSLHILHEDPETKQWVTDFHNNYNWAVRFVVFENQAETASQLCFKLNSPSG